MSTARGMIVSSASPPFHITPMAALVRPDGARDGEVDLAGGDDEGHDQGQQQDRGEVDDDVPGVAGGAEVLDGLGGDEEEETRWRR